MANLRKVTLARRAFGVAAVVAAAGTVSTPALADGGIPRAWGILFEPGNPSHIVIRSLFWGLFDQRAGQSDWSLFCSQAFGGNALAKTDNPTVLTKGGRILVAAGFAGLTASDDGCAWREVDAFGGDSVLGLAPVDSVGEKFVLLTIKGENGGVTGRAYGSDDRGDTWAELAGALPKDYSFASIAVAPSDPKRMYVAGVKVNVGSRLLASTADGGKTWQSFPIPAPDGFDPVAVAGILPSDPDTVFVRIGGPDDVGTPPAPDTLWVTTDAGAHWASSFAATGDIAGLEFSSDGKKVFVAGPMDGIKSAALADATAGKADAFKTVFTGQVWGLASGADGKLYAGNDDFNPTQHFMVGVSSDQGATFSAVMNHCNVQFPVCPGTSTMESVCREQWERQGGYVTDFLNMGACVQGTAGAGGGGGASGAAGRGGSGAGGAPPVTSDAGSGDATGTSPRMQIKDGGCAVSAGRSGSAFMTTLLAAAAALGFSRGRARRRRG
jgi:hypothetical protein